METWDSPSKKRGRKAPRLLRRLDPVLHPTGRRPGRRTERRESLGELGSRRKKMVGEEDLRLCLGWSAASDASVSDSGEQLAQETTGEDRGRQGSCDEEEGGGGGVVGAPGAGRKKLRLSKEQASVLEDAFRQHHTLNPRQKLALAKELNLRPRQVEVWFQNRRARTKLKKTEVDCELLKRCCENLAEENRRLQRELRELRALKRPASAMQLAGDVAGRPPPITTTILAVCPSCERDATPRAAAAESKYHRRTTSLPLHLRQILLS